MIDILGKFSCAKELRNVITVKGDLLIRTAVKADQSYIDKQQKENSFAVGFIQRTVWDKYVFGGERNFVVFVCEKNGDQVGYILLTPGKKVGAHAKIQQIVIQQDARRLEYGTLLLDAVREFCKETGRKGVTLRCRKDLEANSFWEALGFKIYATWEKGKINHVGFKASNDIFLWHIELNETMPSLFASIQTEYPEELVQELY